MTTTTKENGTISDGPFYLLVAVKTTGGLPIPDVGVRVTPAHGSGAAEVSTNATGEALFKGLAPSSKYTISAIGGNLHLTATVTLKANMVVVLEPVEQSATSTATPVVSSPSDASDAAHPISSVTFLLLTIVIVVTTLAVSLVVLVRGGFSPFKGEAPPADEAGSAPTSRSPLSPGESI